MEGIKVKIIIELLDNHEDYMHLVTSFHKGKEFFIEDALRYNDQNIPSNEVKTFIFRKELKENYEELKFKQRYIHMTSENAIIPKILSNVNIPIYSKGF